MPAPLRRRNASQGDTIASTDADGVVKLWDVRMVTERVDVNIGPHGANHSTFDISGRASSIHQLHKTKTTIKNSINQQKQN